jgi:hypothetical protein
MTVISAAMLSLFEGDLAHPAIKGATLTLIRAKNTAMTVLNFEKLKN